MDATRPFVGRRSEAELLLGRLAAARSGRGGVVLVSGPAGIGKTRLVEEVLDGCVAVGRGVCSDDRGAPPLWPWARALAALGRATGGPDLAAVLRPPPVAGVTDPALLAAERFQLLTAAVDALLAAAAAGPVVLVLEDLHWADAGSLELLERVAGEAGAAALLVLGTHRDVLPDGVAAALAGVRRRPAVTALPLGPLSRADVGDYLRAVDPATAAERASVVHRRTGGLPLLLAIAASAAHGAAEGDLQLVVAGLLARLSAPDRRVVEVLALLGTPADPAVLAEVAGVDAATAAAALLAGQLAGLLGRPGADDGVAFAHALLQDGVRRSVGAAAAAGWHRRAADVLAARVPADPALAGEVAAHWRRAGGDPGSARQAAEFAVLAAAHAERSLAFSDAVRHLLDAVGSLRAAGAGDAETAALLVRLATAEFLAGRLAGSLAHCEAAAAAAGRAGRPDLVAAAALVIRGVTNDAVTRVLDRICRTALAAELPAGTRARLLAQQATLAADDGRPAEAATVAAEALRTAEAAGDPAALLDAVRAHEMCLPDGGSGEERLRAGRVAVEQAELLGQPFAAVLGAGWQLRAAYELGRPDLVERAYGILQRAADGSGQPLARWHLCRAEASRAALEGRYGPAAEANLAAFELAAGFGDPVAQGMSYAHAGAVAITRGRPADLLDGTLERLAAAPPMPLIRAVTACLLLVVGRPDEAFARYEELRAELGSLPRDVRWGGTLLNLTQLAVSFDDAPTAEALAADLDRWRDCRGVVGIQTAYFTGSPLRDLGRLAATAGRWAEAEELLRDAIGRNLEMRARPFVALSRLELAAVLHRRGALAEADGLARRAADDFRRLEMAGPLADADRLVAGLAAARRHADPLTERERQVADLVVQALSNRRIAAELVLSERTVESHVRSILAKLGLANRAELIARHR